MVKRYRVQRPNTTMHPLWTATQVTEDNYRRVSQLLGKLPTDDSSFDCHALLRDSLPARMPASWVSLSCQHLAFQ